MEKRKINIDQDFWGDFVLEAFEHIDDIENNAMSLEQNPENMDIIHTMFRAFHTIKGLSGFVEHTIIQEIAHKTETLMDYCRKGELAVNTHIVDAILKASDYVKKLCEDMHAYTDDEFYGKIEALLVVLEKLAVVEEVPVAVVETTTVTDSIEQVEQQDFVQPEVQPSEIIVDNNDIIQENIIEIKSGDEAIAGLEALASEVFELKEEVVVQEEISQPVVEKEEINEQSSEETQEPVVEAIANVEQEALLPEPKDEPIEVSTETVRDEIVFSVKEEQPALKTEKEQEVVQSKEPTDFQRRVLSKLKGNFDQKSKSENNSESSSKKTISSSEEHMKVANYKIDHLVDMIGELIISESLIEQYVSSHYADDKQLITNMSGFLRITRDLQNLSMSLRMVSLRSTFQKITRIARDTIQELGKDVEFVTSGESTEIDRVVTEKLLDPLVHLIKNAISHGVEENPEDRDRSGKRRKARVELNAYSKRGKIFIEIKDDGRGINTEVVYQKAIEKGLVDPSKIYSDAEIKEFILLPGFSTAAVVDNISGRGVGMDVVKTQILKIGGKVDIQSTLGTGSTFTLEVPVNHAIMNGTIIELNAQQFVVPTINVKEFLQPEKKQWIYTKQERTMIRVRDNIIPIIPISAFFEGANEMEEAPLVMILELDQELKALPITNVLNRQEVVVKPVGEEFAELKYISGMSILGTGKVSLILDIDYLFRKEIKD